MVENARVLGETLVAAGFDLVSGGTDNHLMLVDLRRRNMTGKTAEEALHRARMTVNKNAVPNDPQKPWVTSGIRVGTPALTTRGMGADEMRAIGGWMARVLENPDRRGDGPGRRAAGAGADRGLPALQLGARRAARAPRRALQADRPGTTKCNGGGAPEGRPRCRFGTSRPPSRGTESAKSRGGPRGPAFPFRHLRTPACSTTS